MAFFIISIARGILIVILLTFTVYMYIHKTGNSCTYSQYTIMVSEHSILFGNNGGIKWDLLYLH